ncbi:MAG TPA: CCA tRNA nucleotidyltransferase, partial [Ktedonobacterales bacterium]|nr:CCA tRNA nucleotidyltransferase [Ktedonobacterales bacterium]
MIETILRLCQIFGEHDHHLYMVGGCVRDLLLRRETSLDVDMTTDARPDEIKRLAGLTHPRDIFVVGEKFGTVRLHYARPADLAPTPESSAAAVAAGATFSPSPAALTSDPPPDVDVIEITTFRSDRYDPASRKPEVTFGDRLEDDLLRRDFTINAIARDPVTDELFDPYGGRDDLREGLIRAVGNDPERRFDEDPLRLLRAVRFAAQLGFTIEEGTGAAIGRQAATLAKISRERIRDEFTKVLTSPDPMRGLRLLVDGGLMASIVPEVMELRGVSQRPVHSKDVYEHVLRVVANTPPRPATRWAGLLHDIAKPRTRSVEDGKV